MTNLKRLGGAVLLTCALGLTAFGDCPVPGQIDTPPCTSAARPAPDDPLQNDLTAPGQIGTPPAASESASVDLVSIAELALNALMLF